MNKLNKKKMQTIITYAFIPEIFLTMCALGHILINSLCLMNYSIKSRVLLLENVAQIIFILSLTLLLTSNTEIEGFFVNFLFNVTLEF